MKNLKWALPLLFIGILFAACENDKLPDPTPSGFCDTLGPVTYDSHVKAIIDNNCAFGGCHSPSDPQGDFTSYTTMGSYLNENLFEDRVLVAGDMPPGTAELNQEELDIITCWVEAGYPEN